MKESNGSQHTNPPLLTPQQAASRAQIDRQTLEKWIEEGCPIIRFSSRLFRIPVVEFDAWWHRKIEGDIVPDLGVSNGTSLKRARELSKG